MAKRDRSQFPPAPEPLPAPAVDNHTHLESIFPFWPRARSSDAGELQMVGELLTEAFAAGITRVVQCGCELPSARWTDRLLRQRADAPPPPDQASVVGAIAIHPNEAVLHAGVREVAPDGLAPNPKRHHQVPLAEAIAEIGALAAANHAIRAIGETGLDFFRAGPRGAAVQAEAFRAHVALSKRLGLALQIHDRDAHAAVVEILEEEGAPDRTVFHCFSGDAALAEICARNGWYMSFAGPVTYGANHALRDAVAAAPLDLILAETDAPYLTPHPYRGQPNAPAQTALTIAKLAEIKQVPLADMCHAITQNSLSVYGNW